MFTWQRILFASLFLILLGVNLLISSQHKDASNRRDALQAQHDLREYLLSRMAELESEARSIERDLNSQRRALRNQLRGNRSRDEFLVRSGPQFAWSRLRSSRRHTQHLAVYTPAGNHQLKYALREFPKSDIRGLSEFTKADQRSFADAVSIDLPGNEVYELRVGLNADGEDFATIVVLGSENMAIHQQAISIVSGISRMTYHQREEEAYGIAFPAEFGSTGRAQQHIRGGYSKPVTGLLTLSAKSGDGMVGIRFWIESDVPACMSATLVAASYQFLTRIKHPVQDINYEDEFAKIFLPYEPGSARYYFRDELFARP